MRIFSQPVRAQTYDIIGLTWDEALVIRHALMCAATGSVSTYSPSEADRLHTEITEGVGSND